jgi:MerR family transcriptional regulator, heat shock protein HspR
VSRPSGAAPSSTSRVHRTVTVPDDIAPLFTVSQAAAMLDMQPAFIRRLDTEGVVCPARSAGGQRRYSRVELGHIAALAALMSEGLTLVGAQRIIELENEVAELRRQLAAKPSTGTRARRLTVDSPRAPHHDGDIPLSDCEPP